MRSQTARPIACVLLFTIAASPLFAGALPPSPARPERSIAPPISGFSDPALSGPGDPAADASLDMAPSAAEEPSGPLPAKQGHEGPEVFSAQVPENPILEAFLKQYTSPEGLKWIELVLQRAQPFLGYIASRIAFYHLPPELLYVPIVESTYNPFAVSWAGAAGLWQLTVGSGYDNGLEMNEWVDQRLDFWKATDASLLTLKANYDELGSWPLALAAYNAGVNFMKSVIAKTGIRDYWELAAKGYLPYETVYYVPRILAIAAVCSYPGRYGLPVGWDKPLEWTRIKLSQSVDLRLLAAQTSISAQLLREGNADLRYDITPPAWANYYLKVPAQDAKEVDSVLRDQKYHLMQFYVYRVETGDTLYDLALYYGVPVSMILQYNPSVRPQYLQIGTRLLIPGVKNVPPYVHRAQAAQAAPQVPMAELLAEFNGSYTVREGDSLWSIAGEFATTPSDIARVNGISENGLIHPGLVLRVPF